MGTRLIGHVTRRGFLASSGTIALGRSVGSTARLLSPSRGRILALPEARPVPANCKFRSAIVERYVSDIAARTDPDRSLCECLHGEPAACRSLATGISLRWWEPRLAHVFGQRSIFFIQPVLGSDFQGLIPNARPEYHCDEMLSAWVCNQSLAAYLGAEAFGASRSARSLRKAVLSDVRQTLTLGFPGSSRVKPLSSTSRCMD